eukprot:15212450-Heterocapsa_arctica.AAC.1
MADLQEPDLLQMQCDRKDRGGVLFATRQRTGCELYLQFEGGNTLGRTRCEAEYCADRQISGAQQTGDNDTAEDGGDQAE